MTDDQLGRLAAEGCADTMTGADFEALIIGEIRAREGKQYSVSEIQRTFNLCIRLEACANKWDEKYRGFYCSILGAAVAGLIGKGCRIIIQEPAAL